MKVRQIYEFTRRIGQQHWAESGSNSTLCGMPMLSTNYAAHIKAKDKTPCPECLAERNNIKEPATISPEKLEEIERARREGLTAAHTELRARLDPILEAADAAAADGDEAGRYAALMSAAKHLMSHAGHPLEMVD